MGDFEAFAFGECHDTWGYSDLSTLQTVRRQSVGSLTGPAKLSIVRRQSVVPPQGPPNHWGFEAFASGKRGGLTVRRQSVVSLHRDNQTYRLSDGNRS